MRELKWFATLIAVIALGLFAAGCGDDDSSSTTTPATSTEAESTTEDTSTTEETTTEDTSGGSTPDDVYNACVDVVEESGASGAAEDAGKTACEQARTAFEQCSKQAEASGNVDAAEIAIKVCQDAADQTVAALEAGGG